MPLPATSASYRDCERVLNHALDQEKGLRIDFPTIQQAQSYRHRLNSCRSILRKESRRIYPPDHKDFGRCPFDHFIFRLDHERPAVIIEKEHEFNGTISPLE